MYECGGGGRGGGGLRSQFFLFLLFGSATMTSRVAASF